MGINDAIAVAGEYIPMVNGGSGNDAISVAGSVVANVDGGAGEDVIAVSGDYVVAVSGGDGNDTISVTSDNRRYFGGGPDSTYIHGVKRPVMVEGGKGNDTISIGGEGYVIFQVGGGQDVITISDRTEFELRGKVWDDFSFNVKEASFTNENGALVVTFAGRDEKLTIQSPFGDVKVEVTGSQSFVVTPA
jgi:Ca2+-binding RTX toxin-like protein